MAGSAMISPRTTLAELPATLRLSLPIVAGHVGQMLMGWADTVMIGRTGTVPLAACAFGNNIVIIFAIFGVGLLTAVSVRASHAYGAGHASGMARALHGGLLLSLSAGVLCGAAGHGIIPLLHFLGQSPEVVNGATPYILIVGWSLVPLFLSLAFRNYCEAQSRPWPPFWIMMGGVALNVVLNYLFIYGFAGVPPLGLTGAAIATLLARVATVAGLAAYVWSGPLRPALTDGAPAGLGREQAAQLRLGLPVSLQLLSEVGAFSAASIIMGTLGVIPLAAHQIAITCAATTFMFPLGVSIATTVRLGQATGAGRTGLQRPIAAGAWLVALALMGSFALMFLTAGRSIAALFTPDPEVIKLSASLLAVAGIFQLADGIQVVGSGALRGLRDVRFPMLVTVTAYWLVALPLGSWLALRTQLGPTGMWVGLALGLAIAAAGLAARFFRLTRSPAR